MQETENTAALLGRVAMSVIFIHGGWGKLLAPVATQAMLAGHHLPMVQLGWLLAVVVELGGGLAILIGLFTRPVGLVLAIWCVVTALIAHTNFADRNQEIHFLKNMAMMGGFLYVAAFGARAWSLDAWWSTGLRAMTALLVLRDKAIKPLLAAAQPLRPRRGPHNPKPIDLHYAAIQTAMQGSSMNSGSPPNEP